MQAWHRTCRGLVTAPPQLGQFQDMLFDCLLGCWRAVDDEAAVFAAAFLTFTAAAAACERLRVSGVAGWYFPTIARPRSWAAFSAIGATNFAHRGRDLASSWVNGARSRAWPSGVSVVAAFRNVRCANRHITKWSTAGRPGSIRSRASDTRP